MALTGTRSAQCLWDTMILNSGKDVKMSKFVVLSTDDEGDSLFEYIKEFDKGNPSLKLLFTVFIDDHPVNHAVYHVITTLDDGQMRAVNTVLEVGVIPD